MSRALDEITKDHNYQLSLATVSIFLEQFNRYGDFLTNQVRELEEMMGDKSELSGEARYDKLELMDAQFKRMVALIEKAGQGKIVLALRDMMKDEFQTNGNSIKGTPELKG